MERPPDPSRDLLQLLSLKRHEMPPPGFFKRLPNRILVNIRAGCEVSDLTWWNRLWEFLVREPIAASSYAALAMGTALFAVSVFRTAVEPEGPSALAWQDTSATVHSPAEAPATASLPQGMIYLTTLPVGYQRVRPDPFSAAGAARFYNVGLDTPQTHAETVPTHLAR